MTVAETIDAAREALHRLREPGPRSVGFVPTMGYLHEGHLSLVRAARADNDVVVASIFVNPIQFGPDEDLDTYPRDLERDLRLLADVGTDLVFHPAPEEIYPDHFHTSVRVRKITEGLCGESRPGHFDGVATVVTKLFNIIRPDRAYFGLKDAQQVRVVQAVTRDLNMEVEIRAMPTVREPDGLAMSSRNRNLSPENRRAALCLHRGLQEAERMIAGGERDPGAVRARIREIVEAEAGAEIDYVSVVGWETLDELRELEGEVLVALAVFFGGTRLIDNTIVRAVPAADAPAPEAEAPDPDVT